MFTVNAPAAVPEQTGYGKLQVCFDQLRTHASVQISSKQLRDDLMTMLIAGHETTAAVLTWTVYCLTSHPEVVAGVHKEVSHLTWPSGCRASASCGKSQLLWTQ